MIEQPCGGRLCMDGTDCISTCLSASALNTALASPRPIAPVGKAFPARYAGQCRECKGHIHEDDAVVWNPADAGKGVVHEDCA